MYNNKKKNRIKNIALRLPCSCNLNCGYCCGKIELKGEPLSFNDFKDAIRQSAELGSEIVYIVGEGEPLLYPQLKKMIKYIKNFGMIPTLYSNCTLINKQIANYFYKNNVSVIGKQNAISAEKQDNISGFDGAFNKMMKGLNNLIKAGLTENKPSRLEIHTVTLKENLDDLPNMWRRWREKNILPQAQALCYPSKGQGIQYFGYYKHHAPTPVQTRILFEDLAEIDKEEFGIDWDPILAYPIAPIGCNIHYDGVGINQEGNVQICSYTEDSLGSIKNSSLEDILNSEKVRQIREIGKILNYPSNRYGCRANALNMTGDRFARDPFYDEFLNINRCIQHSKK